MSSFFSSFRQPLADSEKGRDRSEKLTRSPRRSRPTEAPNPTSILLLRILLYSVTSIAALATAGVGLAVVQYYNSHTPVIKPALGSLIAVIVFGLGTPVIFFGLMMVIPRLFQHGGAGAVLAQTRTELVLLFNLAVIWISGALALACDLRGREFCLWDGYWHFPKPSDFDNVCELINISVALAYLTFGLAALQMVIFFSIVTYILLYLDQEALTEPTNDLGGRAYRYQENKLQQYQNGQNARKSAVSMAGPLSSTPRSRISPDVGPMAGGIDVAPSTRVAAEEAAAGNEVDEAGFIRNLEGDGYHDFGSRRREEFRV